MVCGFLPIWYIMVCVYVYIYTYIYIYTCVCVWVKTLETYGFVIRVMPVSYWRLLASLVSHVLGEKEHQIPMCALRNLEGSVNGASPKWMVYKEKSY